MPATGVPQAHPDRGGRGRTCMVLDAWRAGNLALLCHHRHFLKTFEVWTLTTTDSRDTGTPDWRFEPEPPFGKEPGPGIDAPGARAEWRTPSRDPRLVQTAKTGAAMGPGAGRPRSKRRARSRSCARYCCSA